jgi:starch synthase
MNVLFVSAEMAPVVKVGGVGDVTGALPRALRGLGLDARVALPLYASIDREAIGARRVAPLADGHELWQGESNGVPIYLYEHEPSFGREQVYGYDNEVERFLTFCTAVAASADALDWRPDVIHLNDWLTGFVATRLAGKRDHAWASVPRVFTVHNLGYRGDFLKPFARVHGLPPEVFEAPRGVSRQVPYSGLAQGILHSDLITIVSPTYAREVLTPEYGGALVPLLKLLGDRLVGIMNGIDTTEFDPATDARLAATFDAGHLDRRIENKRALQQKLGLPPSDAPLVGMVTRLFEQKGVDLAAGGVEQLLDAGSAFQLVVLGTGDPKDEQLLVDLAARYPQNVAVRIAFDVALGQLIYGGSDMFLMPSRYEPCGLGQMIAMRYGAVPVVRRTGGLADSVQPYDRMHASGTGFLFDEIAAEGVAKALSEAIEAYGDREAWQGLQQRAMAQDFSWGRAAGEYAALYQRAVSQAAGVRR